MENIKEVWTVIEDDRENAYLYGVFLSKESAIADVLAGHNQGSHLEIEVTDEGPNGASIRVINKPYNATMFWYDITRYELADLT